MSLPEVSLLPLRIVGHGRVVIDPEVTWFWCNFPIAGDPG